MVDRARREPAFIEAFELSALYLAAEEFGDLPLRECRQDVVAHVAAHDLHVRLGDLRVSGAAAADVVRVPLPHAWGEPAERHALAGGELVLRELLGGTAYRGGLRCLFGRAGR